MNVKLLLAEDDQDLREVIEEALTDDGFQVVACESAELAIKAAEHQPFDLAMLDLVMSGMSGVDAIASLKKLNPKMGIVIITAFGTIDTAVNAMKRGADEFLTKPFSVPTLAVTLKRVYTEKNLKSPTTEFSDDKVFNALANPIRRNVMHLLKSYEKLRFMDLCRLVGIDDHTKFNFHLRQLVKCGMVEKDDNKVYFLSKNGLEIVSRLLE